MFGDARHLGHPLQAFRNEPQKLLERGPHRVLEKRIDLEAAIADDSVRIDRFVAAPGLEKVAVMQVAMEESILLSELRQ